MTNDNNYVMFANDIAKETKSSLRFIYSLIKHHKIPGVIRIGDKHAISRRNFENWINGETNDCQPTVK